MNSNKIAIIGAGLIGRSWAVLFLRAEYNVTIYDIDPNQIKLAIKAIKDKIYQLPFEGLLQGHNPSDIYQRLSWSTDLGTTLENAILVQECVPEIIELKVNIFSIIDKYASDTLIMASSSSCIKPSEFTENLQHRNQCLVAHPVNPPYYIPLVELVSAPWTSPSIIESTYNIMKNIGQKPIILHKEINGFVLNRLQYALLMEGWRLVEDGICSPSDIDIAVTHGLSPRWSFMGPFQTIDCNANGVYDYCEKYGETITQICHEQENSRKMKGTETAKIIENDIRKITTSAGMEKLEDRIAWRDMKLAEYTRYKNKNKKKQYCR